jgi:hypothetical protein
VESLTEEQRQSIRQDRFFFQEADRPGWVRLNSVEPGLPVTMLLPQYIRSGTLVWWEDSYKELTLNDDNFIVICHDLTRTQLSPHDVFELPLTSRPAWTTSRPRVSRRQEKHAHKVGALKGLAPCFSYGNGSHRVYFQRGNELWSIERSSEMDDATFDAIPRSFYLLEDWRIAELLRLA